MEKKIQVAAKQKVVELLNDYDVSYIDYDAKDNDYTVRLEAKITKDDKRIKGLTIELPREDEQPFLQITLDKYSGVPNVIHEGKELNGIINISFDWFTNDEKGRHLPHIKLVHVEGKDKDVCIKTIEYNDIWNELDD